MLREWLKRVAWIALLLFIAGSAINDVGRYFTGMQLAEDAARQAAVMAAGAARQSRDRNDAWRAAVPVVADHGARAENIDLKAEAVVVYVAYDVNGTWVAGPVNQILLGNGDVGTWWSSPLVIHAQGRSLF